MNHKSGAGPWMVAAFCAALTLAAVVLAGMGTGEKGTIAALRMTARLSFLLFWLAYAGGAMATLFGPAFAILARHGRDFGLGFAAAHLVHIGLIVWLYRVSANPPALTSWFIQFEIIGLVWIYVLAALSVERLRTAFSPNLRRLLYAIGLEYIALVFFFNFVVLPILTGAAHPIQIFSYLPFSVLIVVGPILRWAAMARSSERGRKSAPIS
jgi:hypothetical protein